MGIERYRDTGDAVMWWRTLRVVRPTAWMILVAVLTATTLTVWLRVAQIVPIAWITYTIQPLLLVVIASWSLLATRGRSNRARHQSDKAIIVGSAVAMWFVLQFVSGIVFTYTRNALAADGKSIALNILAYSIVAIAIEITRSRLIMLVGRRNAVWFGMIVTIVLALPYMNLGQAVELTSAERVVKMIFIDVVPSLMMSTVLTFLAVAAGFASQLTFRLGIVAATILPPILPKYDWYLIAMSSMLVCVAVYLVIDRSSRPHVNHRAHRISQVRIAYEIMAYSTIVALILFMTGIFAYRPMAIVSNSMKPVFSRGAMIVVQQVPAVDISTGDIVQYQGPGRMVTHRVIAIDYDPSGTGERIFITKGDNSPSQDPVVRAEQIIGVVKFSIPYIGYPTVWLREFSV